MISSSEKKMIVQNRTEISAVFFLLAMVMDVLMDVYWVVGDRRDLLYIAY